MLWSSHWANIPRVGLALVHEAKLLIERCTLLARIHISHGTILVGEITTPLD